MAIKGAVGSVVRGSDERHWGQVLILPHAYGVIEIDDPASLARQKGIHILTKLTQKLSDPVGSLETLVSIAQEAADETVTSLILFSSVDSEICSCVRGSGAVYLKRAHQVAVLIEGEGSISGDVVPGDTILLATVSFTKVIGREQLTQVFDHLSAKEAAEKLTILLHSNTPVPGAAALVYQVLSLEREDKEEESEDTRETVSVAQPQIDSGTFKKKREIFMGIVRHHWKRKRLFRIPLNLYELKQLKNAFSVKTAVVCILIILFLLSVFLGLRKQIQSRKYGEVTAAIETARRGLDEGTALMELNPVKGRERLNAAKSVLDPFVAATAPRSARGRELTEIYGKITDNLTSAMRVTTADPVLFYDISLLRKDARATDIALSGTTLAVLDQSGSALYRIDISTKRAELVAGGPTFQGATLIDIHADTVYAWTPEGIHRIGLVDKKISPLVVKKSNEWGTIAGLISFGGNLYLLDTQKSRIWKYVAVDTDPVNSVIRGFSELREYLNPDTLPDISRATGMTIDGSVWIGTNDGAITRFTQGTENTFTPQGVEPKLGSTLIVYTSDTVENIYILDTDNKRVVILDKGGIYMAQYAWGGEIHPSEFVVSEQEKKILLLADGKIYSIDLK